MSFENVSFRYPGAEQNALDHVTFRIPAGKAVALVGASGSGKSTAAQLIPRFYDAAEGQVLVGGVDVRQIDKQVLMNQIAFVFQNTKLFKDTLLENIRAARSDATQEEVMRAAEATQCREIPGGRHPGVPGDCTGYQGLQSGGRIPQKAGCQN